METEREQMELLLNRVEQQLWEMLSLAQRAAREDCTDEERARLQKGLSLLREILDDTVDQHTQASSPEWEGDPCWGEGC